MISYASQILMSLMMVSMVLCNDNDIEASAERIVEVLDEESTIKSPADPRNRGEDGSVSFKNVSFSYAGRKGTACLSDVSNDIASGQTVGIIGGTGSSKTTLVQLIPRLDDVTGGTLSVGGCDVRDYDKRRFVTASQWCFRKRAFLRHDKGQSSLGQRKRNG